MCVQIMNIFEKEKERSNVIMLQRKRTKKGKSNDDNFNGLDQEVD
jgi:hypothetical protein